jgi:(p)ppGpp synthase/HD superfamily hydrolase
MDPIVEAARALATKAHDGQFRKKSGRPYIEHPEAVVDRLIRRGITEPETLAAGWLHDVEEDTEVRLIDHPEITPATRATVSELTCTGDKDAYLSSFATKSLAAVQVKLADRYCNLREGSLDMPPSWIVKYARSAGRLLFAIDNNPRRVDHYVMVLYDDLRGLVNSLLSDEHG